MEWHDHILHGQTAVLTQRMECVQLGVIVYDYVYVMFNSLTFMRPTE